MCFIPSTTQSFQTLVWYKQRNIHGKRLNVTWRTALLTIEFPHCVFSQRGIYKRNKCLQTISHPDRSTQRPFFYTHLTSNLSILFFPNSWPGDKSRISCISTILNLRSSLFTHKIDNQTHHLDEYSSLSANFQLAPKHHTEIHKYTLLSINCSQAEWAHNWFLWTGIHCTVERNVVDDYTRQQV